MESTTMFRPRFFDSHLSCLDGIPRYLFRVSDPRSSGTTTDSEVCPPSFDDEESELWDLWEMGKEEASASLCAHLDWKCWKNDPGEACNLMSWTSSILFALYYALLRKELFDLDYSDINILMVDARRYRKGVFAHDLPIIEAFKHYSSRLEHLSGLRSSGAFYFGEYLSQGGLPLDEQYSCRVQLNQLMELGLLDIHQGFREPQRWNKFPHHMNNLRTTMECAEELVRPDDVETIVQIASAFRLFQAPVTAMLLSITPRKWDISMILEVYTRHELDGDLGSLGFIFSHNHGPLPEVTRCIEFIKLLQIKSAHKRHLGRGDFDALGNAMTKLKI